MDIRDIEQRLQELKGQSEGLDVEKAKLLYTVKEEKLYKESYGTFAKFADSIGYHRVYCYDLCKVYGFPLVRNAWESGDIGTMSAVKIAKSNLPGELVGELIEYAIDHTSREVIDHIKEVKASLSSPEEQEKQETLKSLMAEQTRLLNKKIDLESQLAEVNARLGEVYAKVKELSKGA